MKRVLHITLIGIVAILVMRCLNRMADEGCQPIQGLSENAPPGWGTGRRWKSNDLMSFCRGKSKKEIRHAFGRPYWADSDFWYYHHLWVEDVDAGIIMSVLTILFVNDSAEWISFMETDIPGLCAASYS